MKPGMPGPDKRIGFLAYLVLSCVTLYFFGGLITAAPLKNHETPNIYYRVFEYVQELRVAGFPPALFPDAMHGGGFAFPLFYPPLGYYVGVVLMFLCKNAFFAANASLFLSVLVSAYTSYYAFSKVGSRSVALAGALVYTTLPYRFVDSIARGALAECWTFACLPLIFCGGILILRGENRKGFVMMCLATTALLLSHAVMAMYFLAFCICMFLIICVVSRKWFALLYAAGALAIAALLSAWYVLPQQLLWPLVKASDAKFMWADIVDAAKHNTDFSQFFFTDPTRWIGGSNEGLINDGMSFELGLANVMLLFIIIGLPFWLRKRHASADISEALLKYTTVAAWVVTVLFLMKCQWFLAHLPKQFLFIQFAWRMLGLTAFFCAASLVLFINDYPRTFRREIGVFTLGLLAVVTVNPSLRIIQYDKTPPPSPLTLENVKENGDKGFVEISEYLPKTFMEHERARLRSGEPTFIGDMDITTYTLTQAKSTVHVVARTSSTLLLPLVSYPAYRAETQDGRRLPLSNFNGLLIFEEIQPGDSVITITRTMPPEQKTGVIISLASLALFVIIYWLPVWNLGLRKDQETAR